MPSLIPWPSSSQFSTTTLSCTKNVSSIVQERVQSRIHSSSRTSSKWYLSFRRCCYTRNTTFIFEYMPFFRVQCTVCPSQDGSSKRGEVCWSLILLSVSCFMFWNEKMLWYDLLNVSRIAFCLSLSLQVTSFAFFFPWEKACHSSSLCIFYFDSLSSPLASNSNCLCLGENKHSGSFHGWSVMFAQIPHLVIVQLQGKDQAKHRFTLWFPLTNVHK